MPCTDFGTRGSNARTAFLPDRDIGTSFANVGWFSSCSSTIYFRIELPRQNKKPCRMTRQGRIILTINKKESLNNLCVLFPLRNQQDSPPPDGTGLPVLYGRVPISICSIACKRIAQPAGTPQDRSELCVDIFNGYFQFTAFEFRPIKKFLPNRKVIDMITCVGVLAQLG